MDEQSSMVEITLPWPPSINHYWRRCRDRFYITKEGIYYRTEVAKRCLPYKGFFSEYDRIQVDIHALPPDKRKRDLDNVLKSLLDSLQHAYLFPDDNQIDDLRISRCSPNEGIVVVKLTKI